MSKIANITRAFALAIAIGIGLTACKQDVAVPETQNTNWCGTVTSSTPYFPTTVGSYWVYDWYSVDSAGNSTFINKTDSVCVIGDTLIGSNTFSIFWGGSFGYPPTISFTRDSCDNLLGLSGNVTLSATNFTDTLYTWNSTNGNETGFLKMDGTPTNVVVPAGTFNTINAKYTVINNVGTWPCLGTLDVHNNYYAHGIGRVKSTFQYTSSPSCNVLEGRLRTFHIN